MVIPTNIMVKGTSSSTRIGDNITLRSLEARIIMYNVATNGPTWVRYDIILDRQPNGALAAPGDMLNVVTTSGLRNLSNRKRFKTMHTKSQTLGALANGDEPTQKQSHFYLKFRRPIKTDYFSGGNAGTIADISSNALLMLFVADQGVAANNAIADVSVRLRYTDM